MISTIYASVAFGLTLTTYEQATDKQLTGILYNQDLLCFDMAFLIFPLKHVFSFRPEVNRVFLYPYPHPFLFSLLEK